MMYFMNSKVFEKVFLINEDDKDILKAQYVLVSSRVRTSKKFSNILNAYNVLYPNLESLAAPDPEIFENRYYEQLEECKALLATLIKGSIEESYNIIFMCSEKEDRIGYLKLIAKFVLEEFKYPIYEYASYAFGESKLINYNKDTVIKKCNKCLEEAKHNNKNNDDTDNNSDKIRKLSKKKLRKKLKEIDIDPSGMDKYEMRDLVYLYYT